MCVCMCVCVYIGLKQWLGYEGGGAASCVYDIENNTTNVTAPGCTSILSLSLSLFMSCLYKSMSLCLYVYINILIPDMLSCYITRY